MNVNILFFHRYDRKLNVDEDKNKVSLYSVSAHLVVLLIVCCFSDGENVPEAVAAVRPSRRAKTAALEKTKLDLNTLINQEANVSS